MVAVASASNELSELVDARQELELLASGFCFTEGPVWDQRSESLIFSDIRADSRWRWTRRDGARLARRPNRIGNGMVLDRDGYLVVCEHVTSSVVREMPDGSRDVLAWHYRGRYLNSPNDVVTRSDGLIYFTDPDYGRWDHAVGVSRSRDLDFQGLYRVAPCGEVELAAPPDAFDEPNGLCFSPDEALLYVDDRSGVHALDVAGDGSLSGLRPLRAGEAAADMVSRPGAAEGDPDGMRCDAAGNIWCAARGGVWVLDPTGAVLGVVETPEVVANLVWGGPDRRTLMLCTSTTVHALTTRVPGALLPHHMTTYRAPRRRVRP